MENNILEGLSNFKNLKKLVLVIRPPVKENGTNFQIVNRDCREDFDSIVELDVKIEGLDNLEEFYISKVFDGYFNKTNLVVTNCPKLRKIGTSNPFIGINDYPTVDIFQVDETNFFKDNPSYTSYARFVASDDSGAASNVFSL